jgi:Flp pilus assembly pilin Flp
MLATILKAMASARGATAIEYALVAGGIALVIITTVGVLGQSVEDMFVIDIVPAIETTP